LTVTGIRELRDEQVGLWKASNRSFRPALTIAATLLAAWVLALLQRYPT